jgi:acetyl esterase/lipase
MADAPLRDRLRRGAGALAVDSFFRTASAVGKLHPRARPDRHGVEVEHNVPYGDRDRPEHRLDIYRPRQKKGPLPIVLYVHGGGFRILSKDTHWVMGLAFARAGYLVFNISYRLAPKYRFPAALEDCARAYEWVCDHAERHGGDLSRLVLAGESAGANLVSALTVLNCYERPEPWAQRVFERNVVPSAWMPYCGMLQVSDAERFRRRKPSLSTFINDRLVEVSRAYLGPDERGYGSLLDLADPLRVFERDSAPARPIPPCFATVGTADPLLDDTRRLERALAERGAACKAIYYPREVHAFHAMVWREPARRCWRDSFRFLERLSP